MFLVSSLPIFALSIAGVFGFVVPPPSPLDFLCDFPINAYLGDLAQKADVTLALFTRSDADKQVYITNHVQGLYLRRFHGEHLNPAWSDHHLGTIFECSYHDFPVFRHDWLRLFYSGQLIDVPPIPSFANMSSAPPASNPSPVVDKALPAAPTQAVVLATDTELIIDLSLVGGTTPTAKCFNLRTHDTVKEATQLWRDVRLDRITFTVSLLTETTIFQAALTPKTTDCGAAAMSKAAVHTSLRRTDLATGSASAELVCPQGVDKQLAPTAPLTTGGAAHLSVYFNGGAREYVTIRLHCVTGGPARYVGDFV